MNQSQIKAFYGFVCWEIGPLRSDLVALAGKEHWLIAFVEAPTESNFHTLETGMRSVGGLFLGDDESSCYARRVVKEINYLKFMRPGIELRKEVVT